MHVPQEPSFPIPLKYVDVSRHTETNLDFMGEHCIDDHWNVVKNKTPKVGGFLTKFTILQKRPAEGHQWVNGSFNIQTTSCPENI